MRKSVFVWKIIFGIYILILFNFVVLKFFGNIDHVFYTIQNNMERRSSGEKGAVFIPFRTIGIYMNAFKNGDSIAFRNILGNIVPFIPMGFIIPNAFPSQRNFIKTIFLCLLVIFSIESLQFIFFLGFFDIDDIILNLFSCIIGFVLFMIYFKFKSLVSK